MGADGGESLHGLTGNKWAAVDGACSQRQRKRMQRLGLGVGGFGSKLDLSYSQQHVPTCLHRTPPNTLWRGALVSY